MSTKSLLKISTSIPLIGSLITSQSYAIEIAHNDIGQVLLAPVYYVENGHTTDIKVTNFLLNPNRNESAVKATVVFRSHKNSTVLLSFDIYLTPGDVWHGQLVRNEEDNQAHLISSDDSMRNASNTGWADEEPVDLSFSTENLASGDSTTFGHIEVIGNYAAAGKYTIDDTIFTIEQGMPKANLKTIFDLADTGVITRDTDYTHCRPDQITENTVSSIAPCAMQLMGQVQVGNNTVGNLAQMNMTALGATGAATTNAENGSPDAAEENNYVITNPNFNHSLAENKLIGLEFGVTGGACASDNINCIEQALAVDSNNFEYEQTSTRTTHALITFPTKYRHANQNDTGCGIGSASVDQFTPPFYTSPPNHIYHFDGQIFSEISSYDTIGQSATTVGLSAGIYGLPKYINSVNYYPRIPHYSTSGWNKFNWVPEEGCNYTGVPVIVYSYKLIFRANATHAILQKANNIKEKLLFIK